ncbi:HAD family hydrolase [Archaeoglobus sulfaticallidus]|uniref:HAD family hydrolase n=1 Tax=Archaeoglobus sulfaticallidus TaxID=1316941 RepID=UPI000AC9984A|nr:HAD-IIIA family hydrolase [Archaeoglobus sulfaticallidus]
MTTRKVRAVIFDMDNTLFDFVEAKLRACRAVVEHLGAGDEEELLRYFLRGMHGFEDLENIADYMLDKGVYSQEKYEECCRIYEEVKLNSIEPYPHVRETLERLRDLGLKLAVVTDAMNGHAVSRLRKAGLLHYFDVVVSADMTGKRKPEPDSIKFALEKLGVDAKEAILVGDSVRRDIEAGKRLGMMTVYAAYGDRNFFEEKSREADFVIESISKLLDVFGY